MTPGLGPPAPHLLWSETGRERSVERGASFNPGKGERWNGMVKTETLTFIHWMQHRLHLDYVLWISNRL